MALVHPREFHECGACALYALRLGSVPAPSKRGRLFAAVPSNESWPTTQWTPHCPNLLLPAPSSSLLHKSKLIESRNHKVYVGSHSTISNSHFHNALLYFTGNYDGATPVCHQQLYLHWHGQLHVGTKRRNWNRWRRRWHICHLLRKVNLVHAQPKFCLSYHYAIQNYSSETMNACYSSYSRVSHWLLKRHLW